MDRVRIRIGRPWMWIRIRQNNSNPSGSGSVSRYVQIHITYVNQRDSERRTCYVVFILPILWASWLNYFVFNPLSDWHTQKKLWFQLQCKQYDTLT